MRVKEFSFFFGILYAWRLTMLLFLCNFFITLMTWMCSSFLRVFFFFPLIFLWAHLPYTLHQGKLNINFLLWFYWCWVEWEKQYVPCKLYSCLYISVQCLSFSQQPDVVDFMFNLNRLLPPHLFVKNCYLTSSSSSCIYVNDYSFLCFTCTYWISYCFFQNFTPFYVIGVLVHSMLKPASCLVHHSPS